MLTFEKIRDMERVEKAEKNLQKMPENFLDDVNEYLNGKKGADIVEADNVKSVVKRLIELREQKIASLALYSVRTNMPVENLTSMERELFEEIREALSDFREIMIKKINEPYDIGKIAPAIKDIKDGKERKFRVTRDLPAFVGPDMKTYTLKKGELLALPDDLATLLVKNSIIESV